MSLSVQTRIGRGRGHEVPDPHQILPHPAMDGCHQIIAIGLGEGIKRLLEGRLCLGRHGFAGRPCSLRKRRLGLITGQKLGRNRLIERQKWISGQDIGHREALCEARS